MSQPNLSKLRTLLLLGRVSNLPTVWSNCLAGWLLGGGGSKKALLALMIGATFLYIGGMFLNDAFDADFDQQHRQERPIPSGAISLAEVWLWGLGWLLAGSIFLMPLGKAAFVLTVALIGCILLYDWIHKAVTFSPVIMAACRFLLLLLAASTSRSGIHGLALWSALALFSYVVGLSFIARAESTRGVIGMWPCYLLLIPVLLALLANAGRYKALAILFSLLLCVWMVRSLSFSFWAQTRNVGMTVSGLLAGIVLVDLLAVTGTSAGTVLLFLVFFGLALLFQRSIPAT